MCTTPTWHVSAFTHRGRVRGSNEDTIAIGGQILSGDLSAPLEFHLSSRASVLMVADGLGGHNAGALASRFVIEQLVKLIDCTATAFDCAKAITETNQKLFDLMQQQPDLAGMGSTLVGAVLQQTELVSFHVGDSRLYLRTPLHLIQLSQDDVPEGKIDPQGRRTTHGITQALGGSLGFIAVEPNVTTDPLPAPDETLLLCSDGLTDLVSDDAIRRVLGTADLSLATRRLAALALRRGGHDNISIVVARRERA
ncbi:PP2C family protein-serine/threonine phosphatase [Tardiphaga sp. 20_F10_N6_6]|uniref:PP2C family protein-serine/threonine phosphatase n=1 Tax=unclassified Tardiphaga TaxID=2631404 RepID=UPI003F289C57